MKYESGEVIVEFENLIVEQEPTKQNPTIDDLRDYMLENFVTERGDLDISGLDFSEFVGSVDISEMKVKGHLFQSEHEVQGNLYQNRHNVKGDLSQGRHKVESNLYQSKHEVTGYLWQD